MAETEMITPQIVEEFMLRMHLDYDEDGNLERILKASYADLRRRCGDYELIDETFKELVFERSRYAYNDALEYFSDNFLTEINNLMLFKALEGDSDAAE
ncbi:MAG TPA: hypothetical protein IAA29_06650 [Candidatus Paenibacillus intestinavium]|nr:hypothetical protein [Candidatus Paenibacillus intestinavium]